MEISVPLEALALMDGEESVMPESGDPVSITISGRVSALSDGLATVSVETANGMEVGQAEAPEESTEMSLEDEREFVLNQIKKEMGEDV